MSVYVCVSLREGGREGEWEGSSKEEEREADEKEKEKQTCLSSVQTLITVSQVLAWSEMPTSVQIKTLRSGFEVEYAPQVPTSWVLSCDMRTMRIDPYCLKMDAAVFRDEYFDSSKS